MSRTPRPAPDGHPAPDDGRGGVGGTGGVDRSDWPVLVYRMGEEPPDRDYWLARPVSERLAAGEDLRRRYYGADYDAAEGLPRLCRVVGLRRP